MKLLIVAVVAAIFASSALAESYPFKYETKQDVRNDADTYTFHPRLHPHVLCVTWGIGSAISCVYVPPRKRRA